MKASKRGMSEVERAMITMLREARNIVYRDAESFGEAAAILEHVGQLSCKAVRVGLSGYSSEILKLGRRAPLVNSQRIEWLFDTVRLARNDSVHSGAFIRHHAGKLVELILLLEEGLAMKAKTAFDLMVQSPTTAELWNTVAAARRSMLTNSFSFLPVQDRNGVWRLLSDVDIYMYLKPAENTEARNILLGKTLAQAIENNEIELTDCVCISPDKELRDITNKKWHIPILVIEKDENKKRLLGILTAFDLL